MTVMKPTEVAAILKVDPRTVHRWIKNGRLNAIQTPGGHYRIPESEIARYAPKEVNENQ